MKMSKIYATGYEFFPKTWVLPLDSADLKEQFSQTKSKTFIVKPVSNSQGRGIYLTRDFKTIRQTPGDQIVVQRYIHKPYLIDGFKFDLRIYVLVYGVDPLRIFTFREGLARFATEKYVPPFSDNMDNLFMHLTNYAINKKSEKFNKATDLEDQTGSKRSVSCVLKFIADNVHGQTVEKLWKKIDEIIVKTMISAQPKLENKYRNCYPYDTENSTCFEVLGFDIFIDDQVKFWLLEINSLISLETNSPLDKKIKSDLVNETFQILNFDPEKKKKMKL